MKHNLLIFVVIAGLTYAATLYFESRAPVPQDINVAPQMPLEEIKAQAAPDFSFTDIKDRTQNLGDFKGKPVVLNFWASWCPPCIKELPLLMRAAKENNIILVALSSDIDQEAMMKFLKKQKLDTPPENVFFTFDDGQAITQKTFQTFRLPETILIDRDGKMQTKLVGADWDYDELKKILDTL